MLVLAILALRLPLDGRAFATLVLMKLIYPFALLDAVLTSFFTSPEISLAMSACSLLINIVTLVICAVGPRQIFRFPMCGPWIVRAILRAPLRKNASTPSANTSIPSVKNCGYEPTQTKNIDMVLNLHSLVDDVVNVASPLRRSTCGNSANSKGQDGGITAVL